MILILKNNYNKLNKKLIYKKFKEKYKRNSSFNKL